MHLGQRPVTQSIASECECKGVPAWVKPNHVSLNSQQRGHLTSPHLTHSLTHSPTYPPTTHPPTHSLTLTRLLTHKVYLLATSEGSHSDNSSHHERQQAQSHSLARARLAIPLGLWSIMSSLRGNLYVPRLRKFIKWFADNDAPHSN